MSAYFRIPLWLRVITGLVIGAAAGLVLRAQGLDGAIAGAETIGKAFVDMIRLLITPLIVTTLIAGVIAMGDPKRLGSLGIRAIALYMGTTAFAVTLGLIMATIIQPGVGVDVTQASGDAAANINERLSRAGDVGFVDRFLGVDPVGDLGALFDDPIRIGLVLVLLVLGVIGGRRHGVAGVVFPALVVIGVAIASLNILTLIVLSILVGIVFLVVGAPLAATAKGIETAAEISMKVTQWVMELAPFGVAALMAWVMGEYGLGVLEFLLKLAIALYLACLVHIILVYGGLIKGVLGLPLGRFFRGVLDAQSVAYSTASSSATLPVTIEVATKNLGIRKPVAGSVLPLGATINMDGTAIYLGIVGLFAAQAFGVEVGLMDYVLIALTATLASVGAAGIPSAGLFLAATVLGVITGPDGLPAITPEQATLVIAFIFPFDRLLDMMRTATNVTGDLAVASVVAKWQGELDEEVFRAPHKL